MSRARLLDVGNCDPDHGGIRYMIESNFDADIDRVMYVAEALQVLKSRPYDLVLVNRLIFADDSDGAELIRAVKTDPTLAKIPVMLISNYPEAQARAAADGAEPGFGKDSLYSPETIQRLSKFLPSRTAAPIK